MEPGQAGVRSGMAICANFCVRLSWGRRPSPLKFRRNTCFPNVIIHEGILFPDVSKEDSTMLKKLMITTAVSALMMGRRAAKESRQARRGAGCPPSTAPDRRRPPSRRR